MDKVILDATCGTRSIWFDKECAAAVFHDQREGIVHKKFGEKRYERTMAVSPDVVGDFRHMPFADESFYHVVFDPPHAHINESAWMYKMYGTLPGNWEDLLRDGFHECMRVLKPYGTLILKWSDVEITTRQLINAIGCEPLYGHRSGKKMNTHWMCFIKGISGAKMDGHDATAPTNSDRGCSACANDGYDMPQCRECTEHPGYPWYKRRDGGDCGC